MSSLAAATRPTRRDVLKHPWRSLSAIILIMIPVALATIGVVYNGSQSSSFFLSTPRTSATYAGGVCEQSVNGYLSECAGDVGRTVSEYELLNQNIPEGFTVELSLNGQITATHGDKSTTLDFIQTTSGLAPDPDSVYLPQRYLDALDARIGDAITLDNGAEVVISAVTPSGTAVFREPIILAPSEFSSVVEDDDLPFYGTWTITGPEAFTWDDVLALNAVGFTVTSQDVIDNPPPADQVALEDDFAAYDPGFWGYVEAAVWMVPTVILAFLLLMLISPVFTISVSRQTRNFALLASQGATPRHIRWAVLTYGMFAGLVGATLGMFLGVVGAATWWAVTYPAWPVVIEWQWLLLVWVLALTGSTAAAFLPAFIAARSSIIRGIQGGEADRIMLWRSWMAIGPVLTLVLSVMFLWLQLTENPSGNQIYSNQAYVPWRESLFGFGILFAVISVVSSAPAVVWLLGHLRGGLALRLASRDLLRQSMRSIPAVAALAGVIMVATGVMVTSSAYSEKNLATAESVYPQGTMFLSLDNGISSDLDAGVRRVEEQVGEVTRIDVYGSGDTSRWMDLDGSLYNFSDSRDWVYGVGDALNAPVVIASPELVDFFGVADVDLGGQAVLVSSLDAPETTASLEIEQYEDNSQDTEEIASTTVEIRPVLPALSGDRLLTEATFAALGVDREVLGAVLVPGGRISSSDYQVLNDFFVDTAGVYLNSAAWPSDYRHDNLLVSAVVTVLIIAVMALVLALSSQQIRRQKVILDAVGAEPNLTRASNSFFGALCVIGAALLGLVTGHAGGLLLASLSRTNDAGVTIFYGTLDFTEPLWPMIIGTLVLAPLIVATIAWVFTPKVKLAEYREG